MMHKSFILSCEHASNRVPAKFAFLFKSRSRILQTHRGYDIGVAPLARTLQRQLNVPLHVYPFTRLLIDPNRCVPSHLFSQFSEKLPLSQKADVIQRYYQPYQQKLADHIAGDIRRGRSVLHLSVHSFTPIWNGRRRNADIGILYDPSRQYEKQFAIRLQNQLGQRPFKIRRNYPYRGKADGLTRLFRSQWSARQYQGIELEFNQALIAEMSRKELNEFVSFCAKSLTAAWKETAAEIKTIH